MNRARWALLSTLPFLACASTGPKADSDYPMSSEYAPLVVGASWTYDVKYPGQTGEFVVKLISQKDGYFLDNRKGALQHTINGLRDRDRYLIRHPIKVGTAWKSVVGPSAVEHLRIEEVGSKCESFAGRFNDCLVVSGRLRRDRNMQLHIRWVWARGVGLVHIDTEAELAGKGRVPQVSQSLKDYSLAPKDEKSAAKNPTKKRAEDDGPDTWSSE